MIIVEGPDGSGKTTLTEMLLQYSVVNKILPSPRIPAKGDAERMKVETDRYLRLWGEDNEVAVDRYLFSEMVYGPVLRGKAAFSRNEYLTKLLEIMMSGSIVIFCDPEKLNFKEGENPMVIEKKDQLIAGYRACAEDSAFSNSSTYIYKWDEENAFKKLRRFIDECK